VDELLSPLPGRVFQHRLRPFKPTRCAAQRGQQDVEEPVNAVEAIKAKERALVLFQSNQEGRFAETTSDDTGKDGKSPSCPPTT
jgi:hypothetical protein